MRQATEVIMQADTELEVDGEMLAASMRRVINMTPFQ